MEQLVLIQPDTPHGFRARAVGFPEVFAVAETEEQAVAQVRQKLAAWLSSSRLVSVEIPVAGPPNPLAPFVGRAKDDPDFDLYQEEIRRFRHDVEAKECSDSSSTPTT